MTEQIVLPRTVPLVKAAQFLGSGTARIQEIFCSTKLIDPVDMGAARLSVIVAELYARSKRAARFAPRNWFRRFARLAEEQPT